MKKRKIVLGGLSLLIGVSLLSIAANADTINYDKQLPSTGSVQTDTVNKADNDNLAYNTVNYLGWVNGNDNFLSWVVTDTGSRATADVSYNSTGHYTMSYAGAGSWYHGWNLALRMKSDYGTWHPCDIRGRYTP